MTLSDDWRAAFLESVRRYEKASLLREASVEERLADWTRYLTDVVVETCASFGWTASAKGHKHQILPVSRSEYLTLDVVAFPGGGGWRFPAAVMELENSKKNDKIAYSLWKVLCTRADLRIVFCYRRRSGQGPQLIEDLLEVVAGLGLEGRMNLDGETLIAMGSREDSDQFPYGFFKWWRLDGNTGRFNVM
ncbi:MAG: hypothetical protein GXY73_07145 [Methanothrix sp.]|nr:hypothetical protein [Methanothrix sp.]